MKSQGHKAVSIATNTATLDGGREGEKKAPKPEERASYLYERMNNHLRIETRRDVKTADEEWKTFAKRISGPVGAAALEQRIAGTHDPAHDLKRLLQQWAMDCPLAIAWYEVKRRRRQALWIAGNSVVLLASSAGLLAIMVYGLRAFNAQNGASAAVAVGAILTFSLAALLGLLKLFAGIADIKAQYGIFWETSSALKEDLFRFEDEWSSKTHGQDEYWKRDSALIELRAALRSNIRRARGHLARERAAFFKTFKSPSELIDAAGASLDTLDSRVRQLLSSARPALVGGLPAVSSAMQNEAHSALDGAEAAARARSYATEVRALETDLGRLHFVQSSRGKGDPALAKQIEETEILLAHAKEREEIALSAAETFSGR